MKLLTILTIISLTSCRTGPYVSHQNGVHSAGWMFVLVEKEKSGQLTETPDKSEVEVVDYTNSP